MLAVTRGDLDAFGQLVGRHQTSAWNAAYRFLGAREEAEDVVQEAFLRILEAAPRYRPTASFRTYLYRVVTHLCLDFVRKKRPQSSADLTTTPDRGPSPAEMTAARDRAAAVDAALATLPPNQRMAVILRYYEGLKHQDIAAALETTAKAVERLLARARVTLEGQLANLLEE